MRRLSGRQGSSDEARLSALLFAAAWDEAEPLAADGLDTEARRRGVEGVEKPVYYKGEPVVNKATGCWSYC